MLKLLRRLFLLALVFIIVVFAILLLLSPKTTPEFVDSKGDTILNSIAEVRTINLNGAPQRVLIRGVNVANPLLLHLHGGPGGPDQPVIRTSGKTLEDMFTVVYWDQRGAGASYTPELKPESLSLEQIVLDGIELSSQLKREFGKDKIYIEAHSWGTLVGVHMISQRPDLYHAYFGIGQMANSKLAELLSYNYTVEQASKAGDTKAVDALKELGPPPYQSEQGWKNAVMVERGLMRPYEHPEQEPLYSMLEIYKQFTVYPAYSIQDKLNSLAGDKASFKALWMDAINADLFTTHSSVDVPVYIFQGKYDQHTPTQVAKDYFDALNAPKKEYFQFNNSAHWPHLNEHQTYRAHLQTIIGADK